MELALAGCTSLKEKRALVKPLLNRLRTKFDVAAAEVEHHDAWRRATLGLTAVSNDARHANEVISAAVNFVESERGPIELVDYELEIIHAL
jgi:uncharacterized protein YlxP (DUF503 family)